MKYRSLLLLATLSLAACSGNTVKQTLGLNRGAPDEFRVVSRPPLSVPPQFNLRPPSATAESPNQLPSSKQAQSLVLGGNPADLNPSAGAPVTLLKPANGAEAEFLRNAGAEKADPKVRETLVEEKIVAQDEQDEASWWNPFASSTPPKKDPMVNARQESDRISHNQDEGKPVTEGDTPTVKDKDTGVLGRILGY